MIPSSLAAFTTDARADELRQLRVDRVVRVDRSRCGCRSGRGSSPRSSRPPRAFRRPRSRRASDTNVFEVESPSRSAAASTNGLNDEPGLALALDGEVELALAEVRRRRPSRARGRCAARRRRAQPRARRSVSHFAIALRASSWSRRSIVVCTFSPPPNTDLRPVLVDELLLDVVDEVGRLVTGERAGQADLVRLRQRSVDGRAANSAWVITPWSSIIWSTSVTALPRGARVRLRVEARRVGRDAGEQRGLGQREPAAPSDRSTRARPARPRRRRSRSRSCSGTRSGSCPSTTAARAARRARPPAASGRSSCWFLT